LRTALENPSVAGYYGLILKATDNPDQPSFTSSGPLGPKCCRRQRSFLTAQKPQRSAAVSAWGEPSPATFAFFCCRDYDLPQQNPSSFSLMQP